MIEWLNGFSLAASGAVEARICKAGKEEVVSDLRLLHSRGIPKVGTKIRRPITINLADWQAVPASRYLSAFQGLDCGSDSHQVFRFQHGRSSYLVPSLVLLRGLFPLIPRGLEYAFTLRPLEALCLPRSRSGHWTVAMPDFTGVYDARFRRSTVEALTLASVFPSVRNAWHSVHRAALQGSMSIDLPNLTVRLLPLGVRVGSTVHVTSIVVNAVLAHEDPFDFAEGAPRSFIYVTRSEPIGAGVNSYYETHEGADPCEQYRLTEEEWTLVRASCERTQAEKGRKARDHARDVADGLLIRLGASVPWAEIPVPIAGPALARHMRVWRGDGRLECLLTALQQTRGSVPCTA